MSKGFDGNFRPCLDVRFIKNACCMIDRGARYKVCAIANMFQLSTPHRRHTVTTCRFPSSAYEEQAHLGARAHRVAGLRESRHRCRIDHSEARLQRRVARREPGQAPGRPCRRSPLDELPPGVEPGARLTLARLLRCGPDLDSGMHDKLVRATVKVASK